MMKTTWLKYKLDDENERFLNKSCISATEVTFGATPLPPLIGITDIHIDFVEYYCIRTMIHINYNYYNKHKHITSIIIIIIIVIVSISITKIENKHIYEYK